MIELIATYSQQFKANWYMQQSAASNYIMLFVTSGTMIYTIDNDPLTMQQGDLCFVPKGSVRSARNPSSQILEMYVIHFHYNGDGDKLPLLSHPEYCMLRTNHFNYMKQRLSLLTQQWLKQSPYSETICHSILLEIIALLNEEADSRAKPNKSQNLVLRLQDYISRHYRRQIPISELARHIGRSPNHISTLFKEGTGYTLTQYMQHIRIAAACELLSNSRMSVGEISDYLGFCEQSYFNKVFKKITGMLPSAYTWERVDCGKVVKDSALAKSPPIMPDDAPLPFPPTPAKPHRPVQTSATVTSRKTDLG